MNTNKLTALLQHYCRRLGLMLGILLLTIVNCYCQDSSKYELKNQTYFELAGNGVIPTINYERFLSKRCCSGVALRIGAGFLPKFIVKSSNIGSIIIGMNILSKGVNHKFEFGIGTALILETNLATTWQSINIGYRYQPINKRILFRIGFTPLIYIFNSPVSFLGIVNLPFFVVPYAGTSIGFRF